MCSAQCKVGLVFIYDWALGFTESRVGCLGLGELGYSTSVVIASVVHVSVYCSRASK